jgi:hypothetical protein
MSGPIVRTGTTPKFWQNYDRIFNNAGAKKSTAVKAEAPAKADAKPAKKKAAKKAAAKKKKK